MALVRVHRPLNNVVLCQNGNWSSRLVRSVLQVSDWIVPLVPPAALVRPVSDVPATAPLVQQWDFSCHLALSCVP